MYRCGASPHRVWCLGPCSQYRQQACPAAALTIVTTETGTRPDSEPFDPEAYAGEAAAAIGLPLPAHCKAGVVANLTRLAAMADMLLPPSSEAGPSSPP